MTSAHAAGQEPRDPGSDVLFLGRSNVGKSSLINRLLGIRGLARTSGTPGRTQSVNFFHINGAFWFVDLPGYGYAKVPKAVQASWRPMVEGVLGRRRDRSALAILIVDARREPTEPDRAMVDWLEARETPYVVVSTKVDKLSGNARAKAAKAARAIAGPNCVSDPILVSSKTGTGIKDVWRHLDEALDAQDR